MSVGQQWKLEGHSTTSVDQASEAALGKLEELRKFLAKEGITLDQGWRAVIKERQKGSSSGTRRDLYFYDSQGRRYLSKNQVLKKLQMSKLSNGTAEPAKQSSLDYSGEPPADSKLPGEQGSRIAVTGSPSEAMGSWSPRSLEGANDLMGLANYFEDLNRSSSLDKDLQAKARTEALLLTNLQEYILSLGGQMSQGWTARLQAADGMAAQEHQVVYMNPTGNEYKSLEQVAQVLGLQPASNLGIVAKKDGKVKDLDVSAAVPVVARALVELPRNLLPTQRASKQASKDLQQAESKVQRARPSDASVTVHGSVPSAGVTLAALEGVELDASLMSKLQQFAADRDIVLEAGWRAVGKVRQQGATKGAVDAYYYDPKNTRYRSLMEICRVLGWPQEPKVELKLSQQQLPSIKVTLSNLTAINKRAAAVVKSAEQLPATAAAELPPAPLERSDVSGDIAAPSIRIKLKTSTQQPRASQNVRQDHMQGTVPEQVHAPEPAGPVPQPAGAAPRLIVRLSRPTTSKDGTIAPSSKPSARPVDRPVASSGREDSLKVKLKIHRAPASQRSNTAATTSSDGVKTMATKCKLVIKMSGTTSSSNTSVTVIAEAGQLGGAAEKAVEAARNQIDVATRSVQSSSSTCEQGVTHHPAACGKEVIDLVADDLDSACASPNCKPTAPQLTHHNCTSPTTGPMLISDLLPCLPPLNLPGVLPLYITSPDTSSHGAMQATPEVDAAVKCSTCEHSSLTASQKHMEAAGETYHAYDATRHNMRLPMPCQSSLQQPSTVFRDVCMMTIPQVDGAADLMDEDDETMADGRQHDRSNDNDVPNGLALSSAVPHNDEEAAAARHNGAVAVDAPDTTREDGPEVAAAMPRKTRKREVARSDKGPEDADVPAASTRSRRRQANSSAAAAPAGHVELKSEGDEPAIRRGKPAEEEKALAEAASTSSGKNATAGAVVGSTSVEIVNEKQACKQGRVKESARSTDASGADGSEQTNDRRKRGRTKNETNLAQERVTKKARAQSAMSTCGNTSSKRGSNGGARKDKGTAKGTKKTGAQGQKGGTKGEKASTGKRRSKKGEDKDAETAAEEPKKPDKPKKKKMSARQGGESEQTSLYSKFVSRAKSQISRIRQELALLEVYEYDGWKGSGREKLKPTAELMRARQQICKCKEVVRDCIRLCEEAQGEKAIPRELLDENEELDESHIFCAKCLSYESTEANDIILCDGPCNRAYHEKCCVPSVVAASIPDDCMWLCSACDAKDDIITLVNHQFGVEYELETPWSDVLPDEVIEALHDKKRQEAEEDAPKGPTILNQAWPSSENDSEFETSLTTSGGSESEDDDSEEDVEGNRQASRSELPAGFNIGDFEDFEEDTDDDSDFVGDVDADEINSDASTSSEDEECGDDPQSRTSPADVAGPSAAAPDSEDKLEQLKSEAEALKQDAKKSVRKRRRQGGGSSSEHAPAVVKTKVTRKPTQRKAAGKKQHEVEDEVVKGEGEAAGAEGSEEAALIVEGKRRRKKVNYIALAQEMGMGFTSGEEEDGDWDPTSDLRNSDTPW